ncbi:DcuS/MalK family sensor histidine kinase [Dendrosporobacter sp. 1207_IL3150]|uniref:DcuS/MalK family sensor histidine kinase n=1 Tax=Dendrosporobacter sp. 1207_IL3150 TaxID=3084054 RepID=UPI002FD94BAA
MKIKLKLQSKIIGLVCSVVAVVLIVTSLLISHSIAAEVKDSLGRQALSVARIMARSPVIIEGLTGKREASEIQQYANENRKLANVQFIVVLDMNAIRKSHPNPRMVGEFLVGGDEAGALAGKEYLSEATGTLGHSFRAFTPVYGPDGNQVGVVLVGILMDYVKDAVNQAQMSLIVAMLVGMLLGILGAIILAKDIKKTLFGLEPEVIAKQLEERSVMLHSVREAIIAIDSQGTITLLNDEGKRLLRMSGIHAEPLGRPVNEFVPKSRLIEIVRTGEIEINLEQEIFGVSVLANQAPLIVNGEIVGAIATFRDKTEVKQLAEELTGVRDYVDALRSQAHEFMNKLHVILGLVQLENYDLLSSYIRKIASEHQAEVTYVGRKIHNSVLAGFVLSKLSLARERNIEMNLSEDSYLPEAATEEITHKLVTIIGNLIENAFDAVAGRARREVSLLLSYYDGYLTIEVSDTGAGVPQELEENIFDLGVSTKPGERGIGLHLVKRNLDSLGGQIEYNRVGEETNFKVTLPYESIGDYND